MSGHGDSGTGSKTTLALLIMFGGGALLLLVCCGGVIWVGSMAVGKFRQTMTMDPEGVRAMTATIVDVEIPAEFPPFMGMDMTTLGAPMKMVFYGPQDQSRSVVLMQMIDPSGKSALTPEQFEQAMSQQGQGQAHQVNVTSSEHWIFDFAGEEYTFEMASGTDPARNATVNRLSGVFPGKTGPAFLSMMAGQDEWDEVSVLQMLESMGGRLLRKEEPGAGEESGEAESTAPDEASDSVSPAENPTTQEPAVP